MTSPMSSAQNVIVSPMFNAADADVTFRSSDGVLFHVHRTNLEVCTEGFPPAEISTAGEIVDLPESSTTLELLFQYMYPRRHPALDTTPFEILAPLAEAAEKYQVFPAMNICHIRMRDMIPKHPTAVMVYAAKHDYPYLVSEVAPDMISVSPVEVIKLLPPYLVLPWIQYVQEWVRVLQTTALALPSQNLNYHPNYNSCSKWAQTAALCLSRLGAGVHTLRALDDVFDGQRSVDSCCKNDWQLWRKRIEDEVARIPKFSSFL
ncbi:hypothetical protein B0H10DRAFT_1998445 [Mycena sp. CBHHK59/15]|nr:hypothetical protein B0H10DRAFT_1998445 [Mycena sp. CBHHK59/15]